MSLNVKSAFIRARIDPILKRQAEDLLHKQGLSVTQAMTLVFTELVRTGQWPYVYRTFNKDSLGALETMERGIGINSFSTPEAMIASLHSSLEDDTDEEIN